MKHNKRISILEFSLDVFSVCEKVVYIMFKSRCLRSYALSLGSAIVKYDYVRGVAEEYSLQTPVSATLATASKDDIIMEEILRLVYS